jgi:hypothetical protein
MEQNSFISWLCYSIEQSEKPAIGGSTFLELVIALNIGFNNQTIVDLLLWPITRVGLGFVGIFTKFIDSNSRFSKLTPEQQAAVKAVIRKFNRLFRQIRVAQIASLVYRAAKILSFIFSGIAIFLIYIDRHHPATLALISPWVFYFFWIFLKLLWQAIIVGANLLRYILFLKLDDKWTQISDKVTGLLSLIRARLFPIGSHTDVEEGQTKSSAIRNIVAVLTVLVVLIALSGAIAAGTIALTK